MASLPIWQNPTSSFSRLSLTAFEPKRSFAGFTRLAYRHQYRPRNGSVVSFLHCMNDPQPEGSHGKLHRTTKILSHARRDGSSVAAHGARAAAGEDPADRHH